MADYSQNGWRAVTASQCVPFRWITGRVLNNPDVITIFEDYCSWYDKNIENIVQAHSWGFAARVIRGGTNLSNHASGTALDLNAPKHPLGARNTFSASQYSKIRAKLREYDGVLRAGIDYSARKDEMHYEINASATAVKKVADKIRNKGKAAPVASKPPVKKPVTPAPKPSTKPSGAKQWPAAALPATSKHTTASHNAWVSLLSAVGFKDKDLGRAMQKWLRSIGYYKAPFIIDGQMGPYAVIELQKFLKAKGLYKGIIDGKREGMTVKAEIAYLNAQRKYL